MGWGVLGALATLLVMFAPMVAVGVKVGWAIGVAGIIAMRLRGARSNDIARGGFGDPVDLHWTKEQRDDGGWLVTFRDLRYVDPGQAARGIGLVEVRLDSSLKPFQ